MTNYQIELRVWLQDALTFMIEQLEQARSYPPDQFAAVEAAKGIVPYLRSRLKEGNYLAANCALVLGVLIENDSKRIWTEIAKEPVDIFAKSAEDLIGRLNTLKKVLSLPAAQST